VSPQSPVSVLSPFAVIDREDPVPVPAPDLTLPGPRAEETNEGTMGEMEDWEFEEFVKRSGIQIVG
jgi:hypothetical protein